MQHGMFGPHADEVARKHLELPEGSRVFYCATEIDFLETDSLAREVDEIIEGDFLSPNECIRESVDKHTHAISIPDGWRFLGLQDPEGRFHYGLVPFSKHDDDMVSEYINERVAQSKGNFG